MTVLKTYSESCKSFRFFREKSYYNKLLYFNVLIVFFDNGLKFEVTELLSITFFFQSSQLRHVSHTLMVVLVTQDEIIIVGSSPTASVSVRHIEKTHTKNTFAGNNDINDLHNIQHVRIISTSYYTYYKKKEKIPYA